ncbi:MAG: glutathione S-transferase family protein [Proteobacteria bacterium]|nr:glutathione S-transferase family protein [Pseudomonadota bacterium]
MSGYLLDGQWRSGWYDTRASGGEFVRTQAGFRHQVSADGSSGFAAEPGRYHLYVSLACPWAHRTLIARSLKGLQDVVSLSIVDPVMGDDGWAFGDGPGCIPDTVNGFAFLREVYLAADPGYSGRVTVPVLWDKQRRTIVNNESAEILRMFDSAFDAFTPRRAGLYPPALRERIDEVNAFVYERVNNGVYRCGFAGSQAAYEQAFDRLFAALDELEARLARSRYLVGDAAPTEADWRLFTTLVRFDAVYHGHFKCNLRRLADYPALSRLLRELIGVPGIAQTVDMDHIKRHYYQSHRHLNPSGIVPKGPLLDFLGERHHGQEVSAASQEP